MKIFSREKNDIFLIFATASADNSIHNIYLNFSMASNQNNTCLSCMSQIILVLEPTNKLCEHPGIKLMCLSSDASC